MDQVFSNLSSKLILIRHGITEGTSKGWFYGAADLPLAQEGKKELHRLKKQGFYPASTGKSRAVQFFTSGLRRTEESLSIIYGDVPHKSIPDLQEMNFGIYEKRPFEDMKEDPVFLEWGYDTTGDVALPGGESRNAFRNRITTGLQELLNAHKNFTIHNNRQDAALPLSILICHGGVISTILNHLFPGEKKNLWDWMPQPGSWYEVGFSKEKPVQVKAHGIIGDSVVARMKEVEEENA